MISVFHKCYLLVVLFIVGGELIEKKRGYGANGCDTRFRGRSLKIGIRNLEGIRILIFCGEFTLQ